MDKLGVLIPRDDILFRLNKIILTKGKYKHRERILDFSRIPIFKTLFYDAKRRYQ